jgi:TatD DNase family protein
MLTLIDTHSHIDDDSFTADRTKVVAGAQFAGVTRQIVPAVCARLWLRLRGVCRQFSGLYPAYGLHPMYLAEHCQTNLKQLSSWLEREPAVAVGECGLDYFVAGLDKSAQQSLFLAQLEIARDFELPVIVHARRCVEEVINLIRRVPGSYGVVHSFSGSAVQANRLLDLGFYLGFGGPITYPTANKLRKLVTKLPLTGLLLETDSPDQPLFLYRRERNQPIYLHDILCTMAELRQQSHEEIARVTTENAVTLFKLPQDFSLVFVGNK